jgi:hypothetical protein
MDEDAQIEAVELILNTVPPPTILKELQAELEILRQLKKNLELI